MSKAVGGMFTSSCHTSCGGTKNKEEEQEPDIRLSSKLSLYLILSRLNMGTFRGADIFSTIAGK